MSGRRIVLCFLLILSFYIGCSRRQEDVKQDSEPSSVELTLPQISKLAGPYKPTNRDIQIALQNAGFYRGEVDGNIGLQTRKAIQEFQAENNLTVDGKVGPKTWSVLSKYLSDTRE